MFNRDPEELKNKQTQMNNTINEMKNTLQGINSRITEAEEQVSELKNGMVEVIAKEQNKKKKKKELKTVSENWENSKCTIYNCQDTEKT